MLINFNTYYIFYTSTLQLYLSEMKYFRTKLIYRETKKRVKKS